MSQDELVNACFAAYAGRTVVAGHRSVMGKGQTMQHKTVWRRRLITAVCGWWLLASWTVAQEPGQIDISRPGDREFIVDGFTPKRRAAPFSPATRQQAFSNAMIKFCRSNSSSSCTVRSRFGESSCTIISFTGSPGVGWDLKAKAGKNADPLITLQVPDAGDPGLASECLDDVSDAVVDEASELDMPHLIEQARQVRAGLDTTQPGAAATSTPTNRPAEADRRDGRRAGEFRLDGEVWAVGLDGVTVHVPDAKGLRDLHVLLGQPGAQVPAVKLANPEGGVEAETSRRLGGDPVLDDEARAAYRRRLTQLDEQIEQATARPHDRRAANQAEERQAPVS
jgi:hypothetical protein